MRGISWHLHISERRKASDAYRELIYSHGTHHHYRYRMIWGDHARYDADELLLEGHDAPPRCPMRKLGLCE